MDDEERNKRNMNPIKEAIVAMALYNERYAESRLGSMSFFDSLTVGEKKTCRQIAERIEAAEFGNTSEYLN